MPRDLYEDLGPPDDARARRLIVLLGLLADCEEAA